MAERTSKCPPVQREAAGFTLSDATTTILLCFHKTDRQTDIGQPGAFMERDAQIYRQHKTMKFMKVSR